MRSFADIEETEFFCGIDTDLAIHVKDAAAIGLLIVEPITNSLSNPLGGSAKIFISRRNSNSNLIIERADDGAGLPKGFDPTTAGGLEFSLTHPIAEQLGSRLEFDGNCQDYL